MDSIVIRGAREHNLKNVSIALPRNHFIVITGVSGSGKSSLAFDTVFSEGHRRYLEALSTRTRQFLQRLDPPKVDAVDGLSPSIAVKQGNFTRNLRSTVGTLTEIHDFLRVLYARLGALHCPTCGLRVRANTIAQMVQEVLNTWHAGSRLLVLGPIGSIAERELPKAIAKLRREGFARIRLENKIFELDPPPHIPRRSEYRLDVVVDRVILEPGKVKRVTDALELAAKIGGGVVGVAQMSGQERWFSEFPKCLSCGRQMPVLTPSLFSFNHPLGACLSCKGLGYQEPGLRALPLLAGDEIRSTSEAKISPTHFRPMTHSLAQNTTALCPQCGGSRLNKVARSVQLADLPIQDVCRLLLGDLTRWLQGLSFSNTQNQIAAGPIEEILNRLKSLDQLGLAYLTMERSACSLSGGEMQRLRLANQISTPLSGIIYVLDEPSMGLHPRDHQRLLNILHELRDKGNTLIVVEHDKETIMQADFVVDMGPGAGIHGGEVVFSGPPEALFHCSASLTGSYLSGRKTIPIPKRHKPFAKGSITLVGASGHNLKGLTVQFPLGCMICVTGVSGSGKTTLIIQTLYSALAKNLYDTTIRPAQFDRIENAEAVHKVILVDQSPLGRTARSTPATYSGIFTAIRELFAQLPEAKVRGYGPKRFSFNAKGGRCESCRGEGIQNVDMFFLPSVSVTCPDCEGRRYNPETLFVTFKGYSIADIMQMSATEALGVFGNIPGIAHKLKVFVAVGLGYLRLGQSATTLSGGEAQRVKLASELSRKSPPGALYILDEPTTGLHFDDIQKLLHLLQRLVDQGHTVLVIEHHPDVIKTADYVIDLGPEGGDQGGYLVAAGTPEEIAKTDTSHTGKYLRQFFM